MDDLLNILKFSIEEIIYRRNWEPFERLVLCLPEEKCAHVGQREFLEKSIFRENGLHPGNGWGKTSVIAKKHIFFILKHWLDGPKYKTLNVAITQDQSELVQDEMDQLIAQSPILKGWFFKSSVRFPHARIVFGNGAITEFKTTKKKGESIE